MSKFLRLIILTAMVAIFLSGCVDCMAKGIGAYECGRLNDREEVFERRSRNLLEFNADLENYNLGQKLSNLEEAEFLQPFCKNFRNQPLPENPEKDLKVHLGKYFRHSFCKNKYANLTSEIWRKEIRFDENYGAMQFVLVNNKTVIDYLKRPISYFENGFKYGISNIKKSDPD